MSQTDRKDAAPAATAARLREGATPASGAPARRPLPEGTRVYVDDTTVDRALIEDLAARCIHAQWRALPVGTGTPGQPSVATASSAHVPAIEIQLHVFTGLRPFDAEEDARIRADLVACAPAILAAAARERAATEGLERCPELDSHMAAAWDLAVFAGRTADPDSPLPGEIASFSACELATPFTAHSVFLRPHTPIGTAPKGSVHPFDDETVDALLVGVPPLLLVRRLVASDRGAQVLHLGSACTFAEDYNGVDPITAMRIHRRLDPVLAAHRAATGAEAA